MTPCSCHRLASLPSLRFCLPDLENEIQDIVTGKGKKRKSPSDQTDLSRIIKMIMERNYDPVIVFSFSKRECEQYALQLAKMDFTRDEEKKLIEQVSLGVAAFEPHTLLIFDAWQVFVNAIDSLSEDDKQLPQVRAVGVPGLTLPTHWTLLLCNRLMPFYHC